MNRRHMYQSINQRTAINHTANDRGGGAGGRLPRDAGPGGGQPHGAHAGGADGPGRGAGGGGRDRGLGRAGGAGEGRAARVVLAEQFPGRGGACMCACVCCLDVCVWVWVCGHKNIHGAAAHTSNQPNIPKKPTGAAPFRGRMEHAPQRGLWADGRRGLHGTYIPTHTDILYLYLPVICFVPPPPLSSNTHPQSTNTQTYKHTNNSSSTSSTSTRASTSWSGRRVPPPQAPR